MLSTSKARKREAAKHAELARGREVEPSPKRGPAARDEPDAVAELLGESAVPVPLGRWRRRLRRALVGLLLLVPLIGLAAAGQVWRQHRARHVTSRNAAVRGHLAEIGTRLDGQVARVLVDVGDRVRAGQVLVQLEDRHLRAEVQEARAEVAALERTIDVERVTVQLDQREAEQLRLEGMAKVAVAEAHTEAARLEAEDAKRDLQLQESLAARNGLVAAEVVREAEYRWRSAEARLVEARSQAVVAAQTVQREIRSASTALTIREHNIRVLDAKRLGAEARLARAEADLEGAAIRAPADGAIIRRIIQPGGSVEVGQPILSIWLGEEVWVEAWIDEEDLGSVRPGKKASVTLQSFPGRELAGTVDKVGLATDLEIPDSEVPQPRFKRMRGAPVVGVRIRLHEPPLYLVPGLSAVVAIERIENEATARW